MFIICLIITTNMLPVLTYPGKSFEGWYINEKKVFANNFTIESNICLTAKWLPGLPTYLVRHWKESLGTIKKKICVDPIMSGLIGTY